MKGVVFNLLEKFVCEYWGEDSYEELLKQCPLTTKDPFIGPGTYPDSDLIAIAQAAADMLQVPLDDALRDFGRFCFPHLLAKLPSLEDYQGNAKQFLTDANTIVHKEVKKLYPRAETPQFIPRDTGENSLQIEYHSSRRLCAFMEGLLYGVAEHFNTPMRFEQRQCMHHGHSHCSFDITFGARND